MNARKPLDLTAYDLEAFPHLVAKARATTRRKRLTDAELAAEYWFMDAVMADQTARAASAGYVAPGDVLSARADFEVIKRFATRPHYDEAGQ